jgi:hypothetical protein
MRTLGLVGKVLYASIANHLRIGKTACAQGPVRSHILMHHGNWIPGWRPILDQLAPGAYGLVSKRR